MKVALVGRFGESDILSGPERVARELFWELKNKNIQIVFLEYFFSDYEGSSIFRKLFGKQYFNNQCIQRMGLFPLIFTILKEKFDIIHVVNGQRFILFLELIKKLISGKIVTTFHGFILNEIPKTQYFKKRNFIEFWVEAFLVNNSEILIFPSKILYTTFNRHYEISNNKFKIIPNGISKIFHDENISFPRTYDPLKIVFYNGSNNSIDRGLAQLLQRIKNVKSNIDLFIIGGMIDFNLNTKIKLRFVSLLTQKELINFLLDKHFIIKSNAFDTFSIMVGECMSLGLIPIVHNKIGLIDFLENNLNSFIYSDNSENELSNLIDEIGQGIYDLGMISINAKRIYEQLNWSNITDKYVDAYRSVI